MKKPSTCCRTSLGLALATAMALTGMVATMPAFAQVPPTESVKLVDKISDTDIVLGQTADMSGPIASSTKEATEVALAYFDRLNKNGGIAGRKIRLQRLDDGYDPKRSVDNLRQLAQDKRVLAVTMGRGTANAEAIMKELDELRVPVVGWSGGSRAMHSPLNRYLFNFRPPYALEIERVLTQLQAQGATRIAVVYTDDAFGRDAFQGYEPGLSANQLVGTSVVAIPRGAEPDVKEAVAKTVPSRPDSVIGICAPKPCATLVKALRASGYTGRFVSLSATSTAAYIKELGDAGRGVIVSQVFPPPNSGSMAASKDFQILANDYKLSKSYTSMEGYVTAATLVEAIRCAGPVPTRERLIGALETMNPFDLGGFLVSFSPKNRTGSRHVDLTIIGPDGRFIR
jgi:branched-chain amino acid transport system substrate-binding protein